MMDGLDQEIVLRMQARMKGGDIRQGCLSVFGWWIEVDDATRVAQEIRDESTADLRARLEVAEGLIRKLEPELDDDEFDGDVGWSMRNHYIWAMPAEHALLASLTEGANT